MTIEIASSYPDLVCSGLVNSGTAWLIAYEGGGCAEPRGLREAQGFFDGKGESEVARASSRFVPWATLAVSYASDAKDSCRAQGASSRRKWDSPATPQEELSSATSQGGTHRRLFNTDTQFAQPEIPWTAEVWGRPFLHNPPEVSLGGFQLGVPPSSNECHRGSWDQSKNLRRITNWNNRALKSRDLAPATIARSIQTDGNAMNTFFQTS
ncbi:hypothetical protein CIRG_01304 [Coccidioides immitis RMSCC 2394]|uniref:Uncharacterized protein n=1 Tax=Coccidioides immitis RMSCC 2394 TaxID=404692 RepID=A0A0J6Y2E4_COCIT|nr:hypothetical protein CIRG_01304 [Coccidioides immitis RMSCC 2394]